MGLEIDSIYCQAGTNGQVLTGQRTLSTRDLVASLEIDVSLKGLNTTPAADRPNDGKAFGPDTAGTTTSGINEALTSLATTGGHITVGPGQFTLGFYILIQQSNVTIDLDPGSVINLPTNPSWSHQGSGPSQPRHPAIIVYNCSNTILRGNGARFIALTPAGNNFNTGLTITASVDHFTWETLNFSNFSNFSGETTAYHDGAVGAWSNLLGRSNTYTNGGNTVTPDGGGFRISDNSPGTSHDIVLENETVANPVFYGYDIGGGGSLPLTNITLINPHVFAPVATTTAAVLVNLERMVNPTSVKFTCLGGHLFGGTIGAQIGNGWSDVTYVGTVIESCQRSGIKLVSSSGTVQGVTLTGLTLKNNVQAGGATNGGIAFTVVTNGVDTGAIADVTVTGGHFYDDQGSKTQLFGVVFNHVGAGGSTWSNFVFNGVDMVGNATGAVNFIMTQGTIGGLVMVNCPGLNPLPKVSQPFDLVGLTIGRQSLSATGSTAAPTASTTYTINGSPCFITTAVNGAASVSITITDGNGNTVQSGLTALTAQYFPIGWTINWGAFTGGPPTASIWYA